MARIVCFTPRLAEARPLAEEALEVLRELKEELPEDQQLKTALLNCWMDLAMIDIRLQKFQSAETWLKQVQQVNQLDLSRSPNNEQFRKDRTRYLYFLIQLHAGRLNPQLAKETAVQLRDLGWHPPKNTFYAACGLARCIPLIIGHSRLNEDEQRRQSQEYADQALDFVQQAVGLGYDDKRILDEDTDLDPLRTRVDFQRIIKNLEAVAGQ